MAYILTFFRPIVSLSQNIDVINTDLRQFDVFVGHYKFYQEPVIPKLPFYEVHNVYSMTNTNLQKEIVIC